MACGKIHLPRQFADGKASSVLATHDPDGSLNAAIRRFSDGTYSRLRVDTGTPGVIFVRTSVVFAAGLDRKFRVVRSVFPFRHDDILRERMTVGRLGSFDTNPVCGSLSVLARIQNM